MPRTEQGCVAGGHILSLNFVNRLNSSLERILPEQRLFLRSDGATRFVRLRPLTQLLGLGGVVAVLGWTLIASSILVIDTISSGSHRDQALRAQDAFEERLDELSAERDARAAEAVAAQQRFTVALDQVSQMQSKLLAMDERRRELETGLQVVQQTLREAMNERDDAQRLAAAAGDKDPSSNHGSVDDELSVTLDVLSEELRTAAAERVEALHEAETARSTLADVEEQRDEIIARNDEILNQLENAVTVSVKPLDKVFRSVGMNPDEVLRTIRSGFSGQGGPLTPLSQSTRGNAALSKEETKAKQIIVTLDQMNTYRIAIEKLPLAMPVKSNFRYSSGFGRRWGRMHEGIDMAAPVGTPIYATGDGVVTFAGRQNGYGNLIKIQHELGVETRFGHLSRIRVKKGQRVSQGDLIGDMGNTGRSTGPHLHYEVRMKGRAVDPMTFIKAASNVF
ncbi:Murein DD-endopeptidase MepM and murein hydrolase activator NlpD, contain LysM domain [Paracoccus seriniphilus]|uniref:Murein DD-endopeptidase MepM and murein hydrolase activator NlpD, contain LysM domain n=1 Tax=Paracoccus seriniphilus TaxID=184748 RepID=A0A239PVR2_9RHOB|nr:Murein DD-endopeptidase MepM and murein hydrolase activator NlpD, contain LysM domain [Paracoccus seriniphilus]